MLTLDTIPTSNGLLLKRDGLLAGNVRYNVDSRTFFLHDFDSPIGWTPPREFATTTSASYWVLAHEEELVATGH